VARLRNLKERGRHRSVTKPRRSLSRFEKNIKAFELQMIYREAGTLAVGGRAVLPRAALAERRPKSRHSDISILVGSPFMLDLVFMSLWIGSNVSRITAASAAWAAAWHERHDIPIEKIFPKLLWMKCVFI
jgi:hypothetical protein